MSFGLLNMRIQRAFLKYLHSVLLSDCEAYMGSNGEFDSASYSQNRFAEADWPFIEHFTMTHMFDEYLNEFRSAQPEPGASTESHLSTKSMDAIPSPSSSLTPRGIDHSASAPASLTPAMTPANFVSSLFKRVAVIRSDEEPMADVAEAPKLLVTLEDEEMLAKLTQAEEPNASNGRRLFDIHVFDKVKEARYGTRYASLSKSIEARMYFCFIFFSLLIPPQWPL